MMYVYIKYINGGGYKYEGFRHMEVRSHQIISKRTLSQRFNFNNHECIVGLL